MGIQLILVASLFVAVSNLFFRRSIDSGGTSKAFLMIQLFLTFIVAIFLNPVRTGNYTWSYPMAAFGLSGGIVLGAMMAVLGKALETGPAGLTFAILNSSTVMPMIIMVLFFGSAFGYVYTTSNGIGSILVILGLFWAGWGTLKSKKMIKWASFAFAAFLLHVIFLVFMQWRALFLNFPGENGLLLSFATEDIANEWFMPMIFLSAFIFQAVIYVTSIKRLPNRQEVLYGILGGITNGIGTFFLIRATEVSTSFEHALIFPLFSVTIILLCNVWGHFLYKEKVNWKANAFCVLGLLVGTLNWSILLSQKSMNP